MGMSEAIKIILDSFRGFFIWLLALLGLDAMDIPMFFGAIVTITVGLNALFTLRNHIKNYLSEKK